MFLLKVYQSFNPVSIQCFFTDSTIIIKFIWTSMTNNLLKQDVNWTYIRSSEDVQDVLYTSYARSYVLCLRGTGRCGKLSACYIDNDFRYDTCSEQNNANEKK